MNMRKLANSPWKWKLRLKALMRALGIMSPCSHSKVRSDRWNSPSGCPMISSTCLDCGWYDDGPVYGDPWLPHQATCDQEPKDYTIKW